MAQAQHCQHENQEHLGGTVEYIDAVYYRTNSVYCRDCGETVDSVYRQPSTGSDCVHFDCVHAEWEFVAQVTDQYVTIYSRGEIVDAIPQRLVGH